MNQKTAMSCLAALGLAMGLAGCANNTSETPKLGVPGAQQVFLYGITPQNYAPIYGFDIAYVGSTGNFYLAESSTVASILTLSTGNLSSFSQTGLMGGGDFVGSPGTDSVHDYEGGPNGVLEVIGSNSVQVWVGDDANFTMLSGAGSYTATAAADHMCDSSVKMLDKANPAGPYIIYTNGCFKADELSYDSDHKIILIANPEEDSTLVTNTNGAPTDPFISLINADLSAVATPTGQSPDVVPSSYVLTQLAFNGKNNTPDARWNYSGYSPVGGIEQSVYSHATGYFYVAVPNDAADTTNPADGAIAVIDPVNKKALTKIQLSNCAPSGMALGPDEKEVFLACAGPAGLQVVSLVTQGSVTKGQTLKTISLGASFDNGCDEAWYNPSLNQYMTACQIDYAGGAIVPIINAGTGLDSSSIKLAQTLNVDPTGGGFTHSVASDPVTGAILVPLQPGDSLCPTYSSASSTGVGCIGVWAPQGSWLQQGIF